MLFSHVVNSIKFNFGGCFLITQDKLMYPLEMCSVILGCTYFGSFIRYVDFLAH